MRVRWTASGPTIYAYVGNDPLGSVDPSGLCPVCAWAVYYGLMYAEELTVASVVTAEVASGVPNPVSAPVSFTGRAAQQLSYDVYYGMKNSEPVYVGITKNLAGRACQHGDRFDALQQITINPLTRDQARAVEQSLINNNPQFENQINSIAQNRSWYDEAIQWGQSWLSSHGIK